MNSLSWLIYLADVAGNIEALLSIPLIVSTIGLMVAGIVYCACFGDKYSVSEFTVAKKAFKILLPTILVSAILIMVIPARKTIMLIAASEFGEEIAQSDKAKNVGNKAYRALDKMLSEYLNTEAAE